MDPKRWLMFVCAGSMALCAPASAASLALLQAAPAQDKPVAAAAPAPAPVASAPSDGWNFKLKPYLWFAGISGDVTIGNLPSQDVDISFSDLWDHLDFAGMLGFEARKADARWSLGSDLIYMHLTDQGPLTGNDITLQAIMGEVDAYCRPGGPEWLEVLAGVRYWNFEAKVDSISADKTTDWVDPVLGARGTWHPWSEPWTLIARVDGGGFGVGSDWTYQIDGAVHYAFNKSIEVGAGYRRLAFDYKPNNVEWDLALSGPYFGVTWSF